MLVVLPEEGRFEEVEGRLGADFLDEVDEKRRPNAFAKLTMPRFDFKTDLELIKSLTSMGMMAPFGSGADFASITKEAELCSQATPCTGRTSR
jgi:serpin B